MPYDFLAKLIIPYSIPLYVALSLVLECILLYGPLLLQSKPYVQEFWLLYMCRIHVVVRVGARGAKRILVVTSANMTIVDFDR
jgi:hypothetical protein